MKLKELRKNLNLTQEEIAKQLGIQKQTYQNYELQKREPDFETLIKLADYFHTTIDNLLEHNVPYLLDLSTFSSEQKKVLDEIRNLSNENCNRVLDFITGIKIAEEEKQKIINLYKKGE